MCCPGRGPAKEGSIAGSPPPCRRASGRGRRSGSHRYPCRVGRGTEPSMTTRRSSTGKNPPPPKPKRGRVPRSCSRLRGGLPVPALVVPVRPVLLEPHLTVRRGQARRRARGGPSVVAPTARAAREVVVGHGRLFHEHEARLCAGRDLRHHLVGSELLRGGGGEAQDHGVAVRSSG